MSHKLEPIQVEMLDKIDFPWGPHDNQWHERYDLLVKYRQQFPYQWPVTDEEYHGIKLGQWCSVNRKWYWNKTLGNKRSGLLNKLNFPWEKQEDQWQEKYELLVKYRWQYPDQWPMQKTIYEGAKLGIWCREQRRDYKWRLLEVEREEMLKNIGFSFKLKQRQRP